MPNRINLHHSFLVTLRGGRGERGGGGGGKETILKMLNRGINGRPLIKIIPACFDRSIEWEALTETRCGQTTGKICPLSLQTFCTGRRYIRGRGGGETRERNADFARWKIVTVLLRRVDRSFLDVQSPRKSIPSSSPIPLRLFTMTRLPGE